MSQNRKLTSLVSVVALFGMTGLIAAGCGSDGGDGTTSCGEISARVTALQDSSAALTAVAGNIKADVIGACAQIAGMTAPTDPTDQQITDTCKAAQAKIKAALQANAEISVVIVPPQCTVDAQAQLNCEGECYAEAEVECEPGELEARCDPGELSVSCEGKCDVDAYCEGSATVAVDCQAKCEGKCTGTCTGKCEGTCSGSTDAGGKCDGTCTGTCEADCMGSCNGSCQVKAEGGVSCGANARCKGGCTGTATAPKCEANLKPPSCQGSATAQCNADCEGSASLKANCTDPSVTIVGMADATLKADLEAALPKLVKVAGQGDLALEAVGNIGKGFADVAADVGSCTLQIGAAAAQFTAAASATAKASASVSVSFEASASVTGSATAG
ncbi:MAG TPA: hypothetical protein VFS67_04725 [Polyangiaceae bacterium]|jgi:hypothetical protein|nr:hypothetical protein [Polyangiaceae bacterium]